MNILFLTPSRPVPRTARVTPLTIARAAGQALLVALALAGCSKPAGPETVWVGHLVPRSGPRQAEGDRAIEAVEMALGALRANGELAGGRVVGAMHVDASRPGQARAEATRLLSVNRVAALLVGPGVEAVEDVIAAARAHEAPVVVLDGVAGPPEGAVVLAAGPAERGRGLAAFAREKLKVKRVALVADAGDKRSAAGAGAFAARWREQPGQLREWGAEAAPAAVLAAGPEAVVLALPEAKVRARNWGAPAPAVPLLVLEEEAEGALSAALGDNAKRAALHTITDYAAEAALPAEGEAWRKAFTERYRRPPGRAAALARDGIELLAAAVRERGAERAALRAYLEAAGEFPSVTGRLTFEKGVARRPLFVVRAQGGKREVVWTSP